MTGSTQRCDLTLKGLIWNSRELYKYLPHPTLHTHPPFHSQVGMMGWTPSSRILYVLLLLLHLLQSGFCMYSSAIQAVWSLQCSYGHWLLSQQLLCVSVTTVASVCQCHNSQCTTITSLWHLVGTDSCHSGMGDTGFWTGRYDTDKSFASIFSLIWYWYDTWGQFSTQYDTNKILETYFLLNMIPIW